MDLNVQDNDGNTPLHTACENGNLDIAKALLTAGKVCLYGVELYCTLKKYIGNILTNCLMNFLLFFVIKKIRLHLENFVNT